MFAVEGIASADGEVQVLAGDRFDALVGADVELVVHGDLAVVLEGLVAGGLGIGAGERDVADLQQFGGGEEGHVRGVVEEGIAEAAFIDEDGAEAGALGFDGAGHAGGAGADDEDVENFRQGGAFGHGL